jgi:hypothetical protein
MAGPAVLIALLLCVAIAGRCLEVGVFAYRRLQRATVDPSAAVPSSAS